MFPWPWWGDTLNITCNFLYCNHQVHRDFLITLYKGRYKVMHCKVTCLPCNLPLTLTLLLLQISHVCHPCYELRLTVLWKNKIVNTQHDVSNIVHLCILYNQWDATYTMFFVIISTLHVSGGISAHYQEPIKLYVQPWVLSCFPAVYRWSRWVGTVPDDGRKYRPKHVERW